MQIFFSHHNAIFHRNISFMQKILWNTSAAGLPERHDHDAGLPGGARGRRVGRLLPAGVQLVRLRCAALPSALSILRMSVGAQRVPASQTQL